MNEIKTSTATKTGHNKNKLTLRSIPLFSELSIEQMREISSISRLIKTQKNEILFRENDSYKGFFIILKGTVKVFKISPEGKELVIHLFKPFSSFAEMPLFEGNDYPVTAETVEESLLMFIPKDKFIELIKSSPEISLKMLAGFAKRMKSLVAKIEDLSSMEVKNRVSKFILKEIQANGTIYLPEPFFKLQVSKSTIASLLGTITETFSRTLHKLQNENIIRVQNKTIFVIDLKRLKTLASESK